MRFPISRAECESLFHHSPGFWSWTNYLNTEVQSFIFLNLNSRDNDTSLQSFVKLKKKTKHAILLNITAESFHF